MKKLVDLLGTKYIVEQHASKLREILEENDSLDLAGAKLSDGISSILLQALRDGKYLRNTESFEHDHILQENMRRLQDSYTTVPLPFKPEAEEITDYIKKLDKSLTYEIDNNFALLYPIATLLQLYTPEIRIDFKYRTEQYFRYVSENLFRKNVQELVNSTDKYILYHRSSFRDVEILEKDLNTPFYILDIGNITWNDLLLSYYILPSYFGVIKTQKEAHLRPLFEPLIAKALRDIDSYYANSNTTIKGFLGGKD